MLLQILTSKRYMESVVQGVLADFKKDWIDSPNLTVAEYWRYSDVDRHDLQQEWHGSKKQDLLDEWTRFQKERDIRCECVKSIQ